MMDFIEQWDNLFSEDECNQIIEYFKSCEELGICYDRKQFENADPLMKKDLAVGVPQIQSLGRGHEVYASFNWIAGMINERLMGRCLPEYCAKYSIKERLYNDAYKIQKTEPTGGYHMWHYEQSNQANEAIRRMAYMMYLNDVEHGGETEFLHQSKRILPRRGTMLMWPAGFTHQHRGNPPLSGTKYIVTGWIKSIVE